MGKRRDLKKKVRHFLLLGDWARRMRGSMSKAAEGGRRKKKKAPGYQQRHPQEENKEGPSRGPAPCKEAAADRGRAAPGRATL